MDQIGGIDGPDRGRWCAWILPAGRHAPRSPSPAKISLPSTRKVDVRRPGKGNSNFHGARPVHLIITMIEWIWTSRLSITKSLSTDELVTLALITCCRSRFKPVPLWCCFYRARAARQGRLRAPALASHRAEPVDGRGARSAHGRSACYFGRDFYLGCDFGRGVGRGAAHDR